MCNWGAGARILCIGIRYGSKQKRRCATKAAVCPNEDYKNLLREDHRFWYSNAVRKVVRPVSDHSRAARGYRARAGN